MSFEACLDGIRKAAAGSLTDDEILELLEEFDAASQSILRERPWANIQSELLGYAERLAKDARENLLIEKRNKLLNQQRQKALRETAESAEFAKDPRKALVAKDIGTLGQTPGGRLSVAAQSLALARHWVGSLMNEIDKADLRKLLRDVSFQRNVAREMWEIGRKNGKPGITGSKEAVEAARIINGLQETMVARLNRAGAWVKRLPGYVVKQTNDAAKIRKGGFNAWLATVDGRVDEVRTFGRQLNPDEMQEIYGKIYQRLASGLPMDGVAVDLLDNAPFKGGFNLAKRVSQHRELHFKSADAWWEYNEKYGVGGLLDSVHGAIIGSARNVALMETYGTNPKAMREGWVKELEEAASKAGAKSPNEAWLYTPDAMWYRVSGEGLRSANGWLATTGQNIRNWNVLSKLGAVLVASFGDAPLISAELSRHGFGFIHRYGKSITNLLSYAANDADQRRIANMMLGYSEGVASNLFARFEPEGGVLSGGMSKAMRAFWKLSGANFWTDAHRAGVARAISVGMANQIGTGFDALPAAYKRLLQAYDVTSEDWARLGQGVEEHNGVRYAVPSSVPLSAFGDVSSAAGRRGARLARDKFLARMEAFVSDRIDTAILNPGAREMIGVTGGLSGKSNPLMAEAMRLVAQFKAFPAAIITRVWGDRLKESDYLGLAATFLALAAFGHMQNTIRDFLAGKAYPDVNDPVQAGQAFTRAVLAGGGATIFGDFVLGEYNRFGRSALATLAGPTFGQLDSVMELVSKIKKAVADGDKTADAAATALKLATQNIPFANLFYARTAFNYLLLYPLQEWLNPGYLQRMEAAQQKNSGQTYWLPPSQAAPRLN